MRKAPGPQRISAAKHIIRAKPKASLKIFANQIKSASISNGLAAQPNKFSPTNYRPLFTDGARIPPLSTTNSGIINHIAAHSTSAAHIIQAPYALITAHQAAH